MKQGPEPVGCSQLALGSCLSRLVSRFFALPSTIAATQVRSNEKVLSVSGEGDSLFFCYEVRNSHAITAQCICSGSTAHMTWLRLRKS
jgi:hypothetical protein